MDRRRELDRPMDSHYWVFSSLCTLSLSSAGPATDWWENRKQRSKFKFFAMFFVVGPKLRMHCFSLRVLPRMGVSHQDALV